MSLYCLACCVQVLIQSLCGWVVGLGDRVSITKFICRSGCVSHVHWLKYVVEEQV